MSARLAAQIPAAGRTRSSCRAMSRAVDVGSTGTSHAPDRAQASQIRTEGLEDLIRARARMIGQEIGVEYAEAFHYLPMMRPPVLQRHPNW